MAIRQRIQIGRRASASRRIGLVEASHGGRRNSAQPAVATECPGCSSVARRELALGGRPVQSSQRDDAAHYRVRFRRISFGSRPRAVAAAFAFGIICRRRTSRTRPLRSTQQQSASRRKASQKRPDRPRGAPEVVHAALDLVGQSACSAGKNRPRRYG